MDAAQPITLSCMLHTGNYTSYQALILVLLVTAVRWETLAC